MILSTALCNMDTEHTQYIRATVTRLNYLLNQDDNMKGLVIQVLNELIWFFR